MLTHAVSSYPESLGIRNTRGRKMHWRIILISRTASQIGLIMFVAVVSFLYRFKTVRAAFNSDLYALRFQLKNLGTRLSPAEMEEMEVCAAMSFFFVCAYLFFLVWSGRSASVWWVCECVDSKVFVCGLVETLVVIAQACRNWHMSEGVAAANRFHLGRMRLET